MKPMHNALLTVAGLLIVQNGTGHKAATYLWQLVHPPPYINGNGSFQCFVPFS